MTTTTKSTHLLGDKQLFSSRSMQSPRSPFVIAPASTRGDFVPRFVYDVVQAEVMFVVPAPFLSLSPLIRRHRFGTSQQPLRAMQARHQHNDHSISFLGGNNLCILTQRERSGGDNCQTNNIFFREAIATSLCFLVEIRKI